MTAFVRVNADNPDHLAAYAEVVARGSREDWGDLAQQRSADEFATEILSSPDTVEFYLIQFDDEQAPVGGIEIGASDSEEPDAAFVFIRILHDVQGYGFGQEALRFATERARQLGRSKMVGTSAARSRRDNRNVRFLIKSGFEERLMLLRQDLELDQQPAPWQAAPPHVDGVAVDICWGAQSPRDMSQIVTLMPAFGATFGATPAHSHDIEALVGSQQQAAQAGRNIVFAIARDPDDAVVGFSEIRYAEGDAIAEQYATFVRPDLRRRGIAQVMKARSLDAIHERSPHLRRIRSFMPAQDTAVAALNRKLGYTDTAFYREWERAL